MASGFVVMSETDVRCYFLTVQKSWTGLKDSSAIHIFKTRQEARTFIRKLPIGFWLTNPGDGPRVLSARTAGVR